MSQQANEQQAEWNPNSELTSCVTSGKSLAFSELSFPDLKNEGRALCS